MAPALLVLISLGAAAPTTNRTPIGPLSGEDSKKMIEMEPGLAIDLIAQEPMVKSPCSIAWDEKGRMFITENIGYPLGGPNGRADGDVIMLEDTNGDGIPDKRTVYDTGLTFPNGVMPWRGGIIVTCAPDVLYFKDTKGDGHADVKEVLLTGFSTDGSTQLRVNCPIIGPDGWVYLAGGLTGGTVYSPKHPEKKLDSRRSDIKFRPDTGEIALVDGKCQFGHTFNDAGDLFDCMNRIQVQHAPLPARYLKRNPTVIPPGVLQACPDLIWNSILVHSQNAGSRVYPISTNITTADSHVGTYTAACGVHIAKGDSIPEEYRNMAWSCEPTGNLARYDRLDETGGTFHATRVRENTEGMRSKDDWMRPVFLADGPDGGLYICDMYRRIIEHPEYLPDEIRKNGDFTGGKQMGRVWRLRDEKIDPSKLAEKKNEAVKELASALDSQKPEDLAHLMTSANGWMRDTVERLIVERGIDKYVSAIRGMLGDQLPPATRGECLNLLGAGNAVTVEDLMPALNDVSPVVRLVAVRLSERLLEKSPELAAKVLALADDQDVHVRYAVALAAGYATDKAAVKATEAKLAQRDTDDKWFRAAIMTSIPDVNEQWSLLETLCGEGLKCEGESDFLRALSRSINSEPGANPRENLKRMLAASEKSGYPTQSALLQGFADKDMLSGAAQADDQAALDKVLDEATKIAADKKAAVDRRMKAVAILGAVNGEQAGQALEALVSPEVNAEVAGAAARAIAKPRHAKDVPPLLAAERWQKYPPTLRAAVLAALIGRPEFAKPLLDAVESGSVSAGALNPTQKEWLQKLQDKTQAKRAQKLFAGGGVATDRMKTYRDELAAVMKLTGHASHGQKVFRDNCTTCHRLDKEGVAVGPDLFDIRSLPKETMLLHIVIPEYEIAPNFTCYNCTTKDGRQIVGIMTSDTPSAITLKMALGVEETIQRDQIDKLEASKLSLMPMGLEQVVQPQDMADLLAYLRGEK